MRASSYFWPAVSCMAAASTAVGVAGDDRIRALFSTLSISMTFRNHLSTVSQLPANWHFPTPVNLRKASAPAHETEGPQRPRADVDYALYSQLKECATPDSTIVVIGEASLVNYRSWYNFRVVGPIEKLTDAVARSHILDGHYTLVERIPIRTEGDEFEFDVVLVNSAFDHTHLTERLAFLESYISATMAVAHRGIGYEGLPKSLQNVIIFNDEDDGYRLWTNKEFYLKEGAEGRLGVTFGIGPGSDWLRTTVNNCALHHEVSSRYEKQ